jgi:hypothetical protein
MLKKPASGILASLPRTVNRAPRVSLGAEALLGRRRVSARQGWAGEKSGLVEHPAGIFFYCPHARPSTLRVPI